MNIYTKNKEALRKLTLGGRYWKSVLLLPSDSLLDVQAGQTLGTFTSNTHFLFAEKNKQKIERIKLRAPRICHNYKLFEGNFNEMEINKPIDLAWIDLMGNLSPKDCGWIQNKLIPNLLPHARVAFTFAYHFRGNSLIKSNIKIINKLQEHCFVKTLLKKNINYNSVNPITIAAQLCMILKIFNSKMEIQIHPYRNNKSQAHVHFILDFIRKGKQLPPEIQKEIKIY